MHGPGGTERYTYDPLGRRIAKQHRTPDESAIIDQVDFTWDGPTLAEQIHTAPNSPEGRTTTWNYQPDTFRPLSQTDRASLRDAPQDWIDQRFSAIVTDLIGTPTELVDPNGILTRQTPTTLWGSTLTPGGDTDCPLRFPGQYHDPETGLYYNYFRYYDPFTACYQSTDPLGLLGGTNPHTYVPNPLLWVDPLGLATCPLVGGNRGTGFIVDSAGGVRDIRGAGRPDNDIVFSGHGHISAGDASMVTVPPGTQIKMYSPHNTTISDPLGNRIEHAGTAVPHENFSAGQKLPDYILSPPHGLNIQGAPITVTQPTRL